MKDNSLLYSDCFSHAHVTGRERTCNDEVPGASLLSESSQFRSSYLKNWSEHTSIDELHLPESSYFPDIDG